MLKNTIKPRFYFKWISMKFTNSRHWKLPCCYHGEFGWLTLSFHIYFDTWWILMILCHCTCSHFKNVLPLIVLCDYINSCLRLRCTKHFQIIEKDYETAAWFTKYQVDNFINLFLLRIAFGEYFVVLVTLENIISLLFTLLTISTLDQSIVNLQRNMETPCEMCRWTVIFTYWCHLHNVINMLHRRVIVEALFCEIAMHHARTKTLNMHKLLEFVQRELQSLVFQAVLHQRFISNIWNAEKPKSQCRQKCVLSNHDRQFRRIMIWRDNHTWVFCCSYEYLAKDTLLPRAMWTFQSIKSVQ